MHLSSDKDNVHLKVADFVTSAKDPVLVHCHAGNERPGAMLACYLVSQGSSAEEAISEVRKHNPCTTVTPAYKDAVYFFAELE